jgi:hypothetical protein
MGMKFANNATTTLASGINSSVTSLTVATGTGSLFPTLSAGDYFYCTLSNLVGGIEIVKVTARSTDTFTIVRGQDNSTATSWSAGDKVELRLVAASLNDLPKLDETNTFSARQTDSVDALISGLTVGKGGGAVSTNTAVGASALAANTTGSNNTAFGYIALAVNQDGIENSAFGYGALQANTSGNYNTALGRATLYANTTASNNTAVGELALRYNTTGGSNVALGMQSLYSNTTASYNTAVGYQAAYTNTTGIVNTAVGYQSLYSNSTGNQNTAIGRLAFYTSTGDSNTGVGHLAGYLTTTGTANVAIGDQALRNNTTAGYNVAVGYQAAYSNTTSGSLVAIGGGAGYTYNTTSEVWASTFVGRNAGYYVTTGHDNSFIGGTAGSATTTGSYNTALGAAALYSNTTASNNTAVGYQAGYSNVTATYNTLIGYQTGYSLTGNAGTGANTFIGNQAGYFVTSGTKNVIIGGYGGNAGGLDIRTANNYIVLSDGDGNPRQIIDSSGNLGLGVTPSASWIAGTAAFQQGLGSVYNNGSLGAYDVTYNSIRTASDSYVYAASSLQATRFQQRDGQFKFFTAPSGTAGNPISFTQAMTLDASGNLLVGTTSQVNSSFVGVVFDAATKNGLVLRTTANTSAAAFQIFADNAGNQCGAISRVGTTSAVVYTATSDYRLKTVLGPVAGYKERINALEPIEFEWKENGSSTRGFLAHKFQESYPNSVTGEKDEVDADGNPKYQGMQAGSPEVIADLVALLQEQQALITQLQADVAALKA